MGMDVEHDGHDEISRVDFAACWREDLRDRIEEKVVLLRGLLRRWKLFGESFAELLEVL